MSEPHPSEAYVPEVWPDDVPAAQPAPKKGVAWLAWLLILGAVLFVQYKLYLSDDEPEAGQSDTMQFMVINLQSRYVVGVLHLFPGSANPDDLYRQLATALNSGSVGQRLRFITLTGEIKGPEEALQRITDLESALAAHRHEPKPDERRLLDLLEVLYQDYENGAWAAPSVSPEERTFLVDRLNWFGKLALNPKQGPGQAERVEVLGTAKRTVIALLTGFAIALIVGFAGFIILATFLILAFTGRLQAGLVTGVSHGGVYAETFALWLIALLVAQIAAGLVAPKDFALLTLGVFFLSTLIVAIWPVLRGIPWQVVRQDVGLTWGRQPLLEPWLGPATWVAALPILAVGFFCVFILMAFAGAVQAVMQGGAESGDPFAPLVMPSHPVVEILANGHWFSRLQVFFAACIVAPIVEEIMFRGFLHRHLREATAGWGSGLSIVASTLVVSFIFAVIHPQGFLFVPALMALAIGFTLIREWRGSIIPSIIAHGVNNGLVLLLAINLLSP